MFERKTPRKNRITRAFKAQAIVEFAIVLPILLVVIIGMLEVGRYILIYSAATNASRNASRYASAVGAADGTAGLTKYNYCYGIKKTALDSAYMVPDSSISVSIDYINGADTKISECNLWNVGQVDPDYKYKTGDRVKVTVTIPYSPMVRFVRFDTRPIISSSSRTILGIIKIDD